MKVDRVIDIEIMIDILMNNRIIEIEIMVNILMKTSSQVREDKLEEITEQKD